MFINLGSQYGQSLGGRGPHHVRAPVVLPPGHLGVAGERQVQGDPSPPCGRLAGPPDHSTCDVSELSLSLPTAERPVSLTV